MNILLIDNYDSFTYNLFQYIKEEGGADVNITVWRNDQFELDDVEPFHGIQSSIRIVAPDYIFNNIPGNTLVGRYHSWAVKQANFPTELVVTAVNEDGLIMALKHRTYDVHGIQFHPESILTPEGRRMIRNFITH